MSSQMDPTALQPRWYTVAQVAQLLGYGETKVRALVISGELKSLKDGERVECCLNGSRNTFCRALRT